MAHNLKPLLSDNDWAKDQVARWTQPNPSVLQQKTPEERALEKAREKVL